MCKLIEKSVNAMAFTVLLDVATISQISTIREQIIKVKTRVWCLSSTESHYPNSSIAAVKVKMTRGLFCKRFQSFLKLQKLIKISRMKSYWCNHHTESILCKLVCSRRFLKIIGFYLVRSVRLKEKSPYWTPTSQRLSVSTSQT